MAGTSWLVDSTRIATKIKSASERCDPKKVTWKSNPSRACPNCDHIIDNSDVTQYWPGLPCGVKFDPSDQEIIKHLLAKVGNGNIKSHPFIEEFIPTVTEEDGICYTHPQNLPGVKQDGSVSHFFHRAIKAYNTGTRKRRKIHGDNVGDVRWHKTGRTKPVILDGSQMGCKKIMVLYMSSAKSGKPEKTNWVMHQYHLGTGEDEKEGEFVVSKIFYQQQAKLGDKVEEDPSCDTTEAIIPKVDPVTPKSVIPEPPRAERWQSDVYPGQEHELCVGETSAQNSAAMSISEAPAEGTLDDQDDVTEDPKSWAGESQSQFDSQQLGSPYLLTSQQLVEMSLCDDLFRSQPSSGEKDGEEIKDRSEVPAKVCQNLGLDPPNDDGKRMTKPYATDYVHGMEDPKQGLEHFHNLSQLDFDTPPDFRLSQLDFGSEDSFAWAGSKVSD